MTFVEWAFLNKVPLARVFIHLVRPVTNDINASLFSYFFNGDIVTRTRITLQRHASDAKELHLSCTPMSKEQAMLALARDYNSWGGTHFADRRAEIVTVKWQDQKTTLALDETAAAYLRDLVSIATLITADSPAVNEYFQRWEVEAEIIYLKRWGQLKPKNIPQLQALA